MSLLLSDKTLIAAPRLKRLTWPDTCTVTASQAPHATYPDFPQLVNDSEVAYSMLVDGTFPEEEEGYTIGYPGWSNTDYTTSFWVKLDLGASYPISRWEVRGILSTGVGLGHPPRITVESSDNDSSWTTVVDKTGMSVGSGIALWIDAGYERYAAQYTRFTFYDPTPEQWIFLADIGLWGRGL